MRFDLVVVGAGPAGCAAAYVASLRGLKVLLVEKHSIPRHKTCGGGVPASIGRYLPGLRLPDHLALPVSHMRHSWRFEDSVVASMHDPEQPPPLWSVRRSDFDAALASAAHAAGAVVVDGVAVRNVEIGKRAVTLSGTVSASGQAWRAEGDFVVGADGATGPVAHRLGIVPPRRAAIAAEIEVPTVSDSASPATFHLEYGVIRNGYAWAFPKRDHLNVGAGFFGTAQEARGPQTRDLILSAISAFTAALDLGVEASGCCSHFHPVPIWERAGPRHHPSKRVLLAGDAACLVNPLSGDGILNAIRSGALAALCIAEGEPGTYSRRLHQEIGRDLDAAARIARIFYAFPDVCFKMGIARPTATRTAARLLTGELRYTEIVRRAIGRLLPAVKRLAMPGGQ